MTKIKLRRIADNEEIDATMVDEDRQVATDRDGKVYEVYRSTFEVEGVKFSSEFDANFIDALPPEDRGPFRLAEDSCHLEAYGYYLA